MNKVNTLWMLGIGALLLSSCAESDVAGLKGRWSGTILCDSQTSDLTMSLHVEEDLVYGDVQIITKESKSDFEARGGQQDQMRLTECNNSTCDFDEECEDAFDKDGALGISRCNNGLCDPCFESNQWQQVTLTLKDENVQLSDPILELWRFSDTRLEGTIKKYCPNEELLTPQVHLTRD